MKVPDLLEIKNSESDDTDERNKNVYWKIKGITTKICYRMMLKYGKYK